MKDILSKNIQSALEKLQAEGKLPSFDIPKKSTVEPPKSPEFGEYTSNIALMVAKQAGKSPLEIAELLAENLMSNEYSIVVALPGYLNFTVSDEVLKNTVLEILEKKSIYGSVEVGTGKKINNEFISANPTGPLHVGNGRGGYSGDSLTRLLRKMGHEVTSEYYVNDGGEQITKLGHSVLQDEEAVYGGEYIEELHAEIGATGDSAESVGQLAAERILKGSIQKTVAEKMGIRFDTWTSERELLTSGKVEEALHILQKNGHTYEAEGALWLRTTKFGDDKDRVLKKSDGSYTYFASDAGHILGYIEQGVEIIIETFGADHHGYTKRFEAVARALGYMGSIHFILMQLVQLEKDGKPFRMSKRAGNTVTIDELVDIVGADVTRFFFLMYSPDTHMTFDLGLAEEHSQKNPVFYVQYAHARMVSILEKSQGFDFMPTVSKVYEHPKERELIRELYLFPEFLKRAADDYSPHRLTQYALRLADLFHSLYGAVQVIDEQEREQTQNRLALVLATKEVLAETLNLLGIHAPEKM